MHWCASLAFREHTLKRLRRISTSPIDGKVLENAYALMLPKIDRLMGLPFEASGANPPAFLPRITDDKQALIYYDMVRQKPFGRTATQ